MKIEIPNFQAVKWKIVSWEIIAEFSSKNVGYLWRLNFMGNKAAIKI